MVLPSTIRRATTHDHPHLVREASVDSIMRRQEAPKTGLGRGTKALRHDEARRQTRMTLIVRNVFLLGENPLVLSHHCMGLMYKRPKVTTLDTAAMRDTSLKNV